MHKLTWIEGIWASSWWWCLKSVSSFTSFLHARDHFLVNVTTFHFTEKEKLRSGPESIMWKCWRWTVKPRCFLITSMWRSVWLRVGKDRINSKERHQLEDLTGPIIAIDKLTIAQVEMLEKFRKSWHLRNWTACLRPLHRNCCQKLRSSNQEWSWLQN